LAEFLTPNLGIPTELANVILALDPSNKEGIETKIPPYIGKKLEIAGIVGMVNSQTLQTIAGMMLKT